MSRPNSSAIRCSTASAEDERPADEPETRTARRTQPSDDGGEAWNAGEARDQRPLPIEERLDTQLDNIFPDDGRRRAGRGLGSARPDIRSGPASAPAAATTATTISKRSSRPRRRWPTGCASSLRLPIADPARRMIGHYLIDLVDEAGYLGGDLAAVAEKLGATVAEVEAVLAHPAELRSAGHLRARSRRMPGASSSRSATASIRRCRRLIAHLDLLAKRDFAALKKICGVDDEDLADMIAEIRRLNPKPGLAFGSASCSRSCRMCSCGRARTAAGSSSSIPTRCRRCWSARPTMPKSRPRRERDGDKSYLADCLQKRHLAGACARPARHAPFSRSRTRSCASRTVSLRTASSICGRSISRPSPTPSACTNRRCRASPPTSTWRPAAASSN